MRIALPRFMRNRVIQAQPKSGYWRGETQKLRRNAPHRNCGRSSTGSGMSRESTAYGSVVTRAPRRW